MRKPLPLLDNLHIAEPCKLDWEKMTGDDRSRHCDECNHPVINLSALSANEAEGMLVANANRICVTYLRKSNGEIVHREMGRRLRVGKFFAALWFGLLGLVGCGPNFGRTTGAPMMGKPSQKIDEEGEPQKDKPVAPFAEKKE